MHRFNELSKVNNGERLLTIDQALNRLGGFEHVLTELLLKISKNEQFEIGSLNVMSQIISKVSETGKFL